MERAVLVMGSNLGDRRQNLALALGALREAGEVVKCSPVFESEPWGEVAGEDGSEAGPFLNMAVELLTALEPEELLAAVKKIERRLGRSTVAGLEGVFENRVREGTPEGGGLPEAVVGEGGDMVPDRERKYLSRTMDIDIIYYGNLVTDVPGLKIPHPLLAERLFVLEPLAAILPGWKHPVTGLTPAEMIGRLGDRPGKPAAVRDVGEGPDQI